MPPPSDSAGRLVSLVSPAVTVRARNERSESVVTISVHAHANDSHRRPPLNPSGNWVFETRALRRHAAGPSWIVRCEAPERRAMLRRPFGLLIGRWLEDSATVCGSRHGRVLDTPLGPCYDSSCTGVHGAMESVSVGRRVDRAMHSFLFFLVTFLSLPSHPTPRFPLPDPQDRVGRGWRNVAFVTSQRRRRPRADGLTGAISAC